MNILSILLQFYRLVNGINSKWVKVPKTGHTVWDAWDFSFEGFHSSLQGWVNSPTSFPILK